ncbi:hypothetical protein HYX18_03555 [Candidatus Woesearchaeota archaeon]|nr:hypothetical protein [Candidatus Woesearchaeota archaeon]
MYIRIKNIKYKDNCFSYAYLVKSKRKKQKIKQKNLKYLGKVYKLNNLSLIDSNTRPEDLTSTLNNDKKTIIIRLIERELINHSFKKLKPNIYKRDNINADLNKIKLKNSKNKNIVLEINEGFLCEYTINLLLNFEFPNLDEKSCGIYLANALLSAGIKLDEVLFIKLFNNFYKEVFSSIN